MRVHVNKKKMFLKVSATGSVRCVLRVQVRQGSNLSVHPMLLMSTMFVTELKDLKKSDMHLVIMLVRSTPMYIITKTCPCNKQGFF